jgi:2-keto-4-pentenoate hydratase/2-oxohepta-3-ene-1,7-dioic acid hydratase in catechol pathway
MNLASFNVSGRPTWGIVDGREAADLGAILGRQFADVKALVGAGGYESALQATATAPRIAVDAIEWLPVIPNPGKIFCVGHNYETHREETGRAKVLHPSIFLRFAGTLIGHRTPILLPRVSEQLDYEGELAVVIGRPGRYITEAKALEHVAGYTCANDASVRDWQWHTQQFTPGKNFPGTAALGPWLVRPEKLAELNSVTITTLLNGMQMQHAALIDMIFPIPRIIAYLSNFTALSPGDVILTGTPGGVGAKRRPPVWMKAGDTVEVQISGVAALVNTVRREPST